MAENRIKFLIFLISVVISELPLFSQENNIIKYVNPFIGTTKTKVKSFWGSEGGTYPGAVAPFGLVQLTPETNVTSARGYDYRDSSIVWFSCTNHMSGYPNGSSGNIYIMPVEENHEIIIGRYSRSFLHSDEKAEPGYYSVLFGDNGTLVEATSSERTGMFRFTFPSGITPKICLGDLGKLEVISKRIIHGLKRNAAIYFSEEFAQKEDIDGGTILTFPSQDKKETELIVKISVSSTGFESSSLNIRSEAGTLSFREFREQNQKKWNETLSSIEVDDQSEDNKTIFYTALYHSFLLPWIISDVNGSYTGADRKIHMTKGKNQYGAFSPWDTFRSLHPLLCLIAPDRQNDMILSMFDHYDQTGRLPGGPMTGNHVIAIIADSWVKGIRCADSALTYKAMKATLDSASRQSDMSAYLKLGFVPSSFAESVTRTVEYAYNDWIISQFARNFKGEESDYRLFLQRSFNYRNLFDPRSLFLLPRDGNNFIPEPGNFGYKEGDKWSYSLFVPHNPIDLINLSGGNEEFGSRLDSALENDCILFDNEPVLHVPYLFNYSKSPAETQKWVRTIMKSHYKNSPDGLPGNDDLGSMSSWYVFSAMGFFPVCPGRPLYDIGSPVFNKVTLHLANGKSLIIKSENNGEGNWYVRSMALNGKDYNKLWITHASLTGGSEIEFLMDSKPVLSRLADYPDAAVSETMNLPQFNISEFNFSKNKVEPDEEFWITFSVSNSGSIGTKVVRLFTDGKEYSEKNILVESGKTIKDSLKCKLYPVGTRKIHIDNLSYMEIEVIGPLAHPLHKIKISALEGATIFKNRIHKDYSYTIKNAGGYRDTTNVMIFANDSILRKDRIVLDPGEQKKVVHQMMFNKPGMYNLRVDREVLKIKIYGRAIDSKIIDLKMDENFPGDTIRDESGLSNHGIVVRRGSVPLASSLPFKTDKNCFVEFRNSPSLDNMWEKITIMAWIRPTDENMGLTDIITKGDFIALQSGGNRTLSFFAGGWGRGACEALLPANWTDNWHHIAGVSDGYSLKLYIDGIESGSLKINSPVNLSYKGKWMIGRNEEFPDERIFHGAVSHFKVFTEPLTTSEIKQEMQKNEKHLK